MQYRVAALRDDCPGNSRKVDQRATPMGYSFGTPPHAGSCKWRRVRAPRLAEYPARLNDNVLIAMPNWVFLPLPIAESLFGGAGVLMIIRYTTGYGFAPDDFMVRVIISAMPVTVSCTVLVENYGRDRNLAADAILWTTLLNLE